MPKEETFEERMQRLKQKQLVLPPRAPSGDVRTRKVSNQRQLSSQGQGSQANLLRKSNNDVARSFENTNVFTDQTNLAKVGTTAMSNSTATGSEHVDILDPSANVQLTEQELNEIYSRPFMNPDHSKVGYKPHSNQILLTEQQLVESKRDKVIEIFKAS